MKVGEVASKNNIYNATGRHAVGVVGARGYSGLELSRILLKHPHVTLTHCFATQNNWKLRDLMDLPFNEQSSDPSLDAEVIIGDMNQIEQASGGFQTIFLATPAEVSMKLAPQFLNQGINVIDLSGAFRLPLGIYEKTYGHQHTSPELIAQAQFGLVPFAEPSTTNSAPALIANPGCYATSVFMALIPLVRAGFVQLESLVIDSKSGASGAGRKASENLLFTEVEGECLPYKVGSHQHLPEICHYIQQFTGQPIDPMFTTHLLTVSRGIISGIYARLSPRAGVGESAEAKIANVLHEAFRDYPLVTVGKISPSLLSLKRVRGSARTQISYRVEGDKLYLFSVLDNLMKGAASQAVENLNRILDLPLTTGLTRS